MRRNIDLTENGDFAKKISEKVFNAREILFDDIRNQDEFEAYFLNHCYRCGKEFTEYPWTINKCVGLCKRCDSQLVSSLGEKRIRENPFLKNKIHSTKFIFKERRYETPWFIRKNKRRSILDFRLMKIS